MPRSLTPHSKYYDPKSKPDAPRWLHVDVQLVQKLPLIPLARLRSTPELAELRILQCGNRLSITPVDKAHWEQIVQLGKLQKKVAVGTEVTPCPPRRSVRAEFPHTAPASGM